MTELYIDDLDSPRGYLRTADAAKYLGVGVSTLERWRTSGGGPKFRKLGTRIVSYSIADMDAWTAENLRSSTSDIKAKGGVSAPRYRDKLILHNVDAAPDGISVQFAEQSNPTTRDR